MEIDKINTHKKLQQSSSFQNKINNCKKELSKLDSLQAMALTNFYLTKRESNIVRINI